MHTIADLNLHNKTVLVRVDFNVPQNADGTVADDTRIRAHIPTLEALLAQNAKVVLMSHLGRPKGKDPEFTLKPIADHLQKLMKDVKVSFVPDCIGPVAAKGVQQAAAGTIVLLENVRFYLEEERNDPLFAQKLSTLGDAYVNDAFGTAHRAHASTAGIADYMQNKAIGLLMAQEVGALSNVLENPKKPVVMIIGGAKVSSKLALLENLLPKADEMIIGGAMANTFLAAMGHKMGRSLYESDYMQAARTIMSKSAAMGCRLHFPADEVAADDFAANSPNAVYGLDDIPQNRMVLDVGPQTQKNWANRLKQAGTILWNGPVGAFEMEPFDAGTMALAAAIANSDAYSLAGGGDTLAAIAKSGVGHMFSYISTGGGSLLEYLEGKELPGLAALS